MQYWGVKVDEIRHACSSNGIALLRRPVSPAARLPARCPAAAQCTAKCLGVGCRQPLCCACRCLASCPPALPCTCIAGTYVHALSCHRVWSSCREEPRGARVHASQLHARLPCHAM